MKPEQLQQAIAEFKDIYKLEHHIELTDNEATQKAMSLLQLFDVLTSKEGEMLP